MTDESDLHDIIKDIGSLKANYIKLGFALKLKYDDTLDRIKREIPDSAEALIVVINEWLKKNYDWKRHGKPTWKALVKAVASLNGDLAMKIASRHQAG